MNMVGILKSNFPEDANNKIYKPQLVLFLVTWIYVSNEGQMDILLYSERLHVFH